MIVGTDASSAFVLGRPSSAFPWRDRSDLGKLGLLESQTPLESGSGVRLLDDDDRSTRGPKTAAAVEVAVSAALRVLNGRGPSVRFLQAVWFSSLKGKFGTRFDGGGGGVLRREMDHDLLPGASASFERCPGEGLEELPCEGGDVKRLLELDIGKEDCISCELAAGAASVVELVLPGDEPAPDSPPALAATNVAASAASRFFLSSASFRCCSSCSSKESRIASMSIN